MITETRKRDKIFRRLTRENSANPRPKKRTAQPFWTLYSVGKIGTLGLLHIVKSTSEHKTGALMSADSTRLGEDIGSKVRASDLVVRDQLEIRPPFGIEESFVYQPIRNVLLANGGVAGFAHTLGQGGLRPTCDFDRSLESGNVRFIHRHPKYTNGFVVVNNRVCVTGNKDACTVAYMTPKTKVASATVPDPSRRIAKPGPDGYTLGQRVAMAMAYATGRRGGTEYSEADLLRDVNRLAVPGTQLLSQQSLNAIRGNKVSRSSFTHLIAKACGVNSDWLAYGIGKMTS